MLARMMTSVTVLNDDVPEVRLVYAQRRALASVLEAFAAALREFGPIRKGDFDDAIKEIAHYRESPCPCGKPSVPAPTCPLCEEHSALDRGAASSGWDRQHATVLAEVRKEGT
jgi:hypothetical protein